MLDLLEEVSAQHRSILELADRVLEKYSDGPGSQAATVKAVHQLVAAESRHEAAEAQIFWPVVRDLLPGYADLRAAAQAQERRARHRLHRLHKEAGHDSAPGLANSVARELAAHVSLEENQFLPGLAEVIDPSDSYRIGKIFKKACQSGPTRPHPRTPDIPGLLKLSAPLVARADRVRDLLRMR